MKFDPRDVKWFAALSRAASEGIQASKLLFPIERQKDGVEVYLVESSWKNGSVYVVEVHHGHDSASIVCGCKGGQQRRICKHAALAAFHAGLFPTARELFVEEVQEKAA